MAIITHQLNKTRKAITLTEIVLAMLILAMAFLPVIGALGTSMRAGEKDKRVVNAMHLAQSKLDTALQFPFGDIVANNPPGPSYGGGSTWSYATNSGLLVLNLGPEGDFQAGLAIADELVTFQVQHPDSMLKGANPGNPSAWGWVTVNHNHNNVFSKYTVTVTWVEKPGNITASYMLISYKAKLLD